MKYYLDMETETIGAFEAKTYFSRILREVEKGKVFLITHRGKRVAVIKKDEEYPQAGAREALRNISRFRGSLTAGAVISLRDEGRKM